MLICESSWGGEVGICVLDLLLYKGLLLLSDPRLASDSCLFKVICHFLYHCIPRNSVTYAGILCLKSPSWVKAKVFDSQSEFIAHGSLSHLLAQQSPVRQAVLLFVPIVQMRKLSPRDCTVPGSGTVMTRVQFV